MWIFQARRRCLSQCDLLFATLAQSTVGTFAGGAGLIEGRRVWRKVEEGYVEPSEREGSEEQEYGNVEVLDILFAEWSDLLSW